MAFSGVMGRTGEDIYIFQIRDDNLVLLPQYHRWRKKPPRVFSPDGDWIVFASGDDLNSELGQIYKMNPNRSNVEQLTNMNCSAG